MIAEEKQVLRDQIVAHFIKFGSAKPYRFKDGKYVEVEMCCYSGDWYVYARMFSEKTSEWLAASTNSREFRRSRVASIRAAVYRLTDDIR